MCFELSYVKQSVPTAGQDTVANFNVRDPLFQTGLDFDICHNCSAYKNNAYFYEIWITNS